MSIIDENYDIWLEGLKRESYSNVILPKEIEYCVIGGGMAGITALYLLSKENKKVILLEKKMLGGRATDCTTGFLTPVIDTDPIRLIKQFGLENAKLIFESHKKAVNEVEKIIKLENIECEFERCTNYVYANSKSEEKYLFKLAGEYKKVGVEAEYKKENKLKFNEFGYIEMPNHAKFHAMKYLYALAQISVKNGAIIAEDTRATSIKSKEDHIDVEVEGKGIIKVKKVVSATYYPFGMPTKLFNLTNLYEEYVVEYKVSKGDLVNGTYEDTRDPYNYFRVDSRNNSDRLIIGGADSLNVVVENKELGFNLMREYSKRLFNKIKIEEVRHWSGHMMETNDGLAFIGESKKIPVEISRNIFYIFGFSGNGMTYSYIAGKMLIDWSNNKESTYKKIYEIDRKLSFWTG